MYKKKYYFLKEKHSLNKRLHNTKYKWRESFLPNPDTFTAQHKLWKLTSIQITFPGLKKNSNWIFVVHQLSFLRNNPFYLLKTTQIPMNTLHASDSTILSPKTDWSQQAFEPLHLNNAWTGLRMTSTPWTEIQIQNFFLMKLKGSRNQTW